MRLRVQMIDGPLASTPPTRRSGAGAVVLFEGVVRGEENGEEIAGLEYTAYEPMAQTMLLRIGREIAERCGLLDMQIEHSRGHVPVGQISFRLIVGSAHRKDAISAMDEFIDRMKRDVPIWKRAVRVAAPTAPHVG